MLFFWHNRTGYKIQSYIYMIIDFWHMEHLICWKVINISFYILGLSLSGNYNWILSFPFQWSHKFYEEKI